MGSYDELNKVGDVNVYMIDDEWDKYKYKRDMTR